MTTKLIFAFLLISVLSQCVKRSKSEDPFIVANAYCGCIYKKLANAKDSSLNVNECNYILFTSRLFSIHFEDDKNLHYSTETLDSSNQFFLEVGNIIDTLCLNNIDPRKLKKIPHVSM